MPKVNRDPLEEAIRGWQSYSRDELTIEDAQEIVESTGRFFSLLGGWAAEVGGSNLAGWCGEGVDGKDGSDKECRREKV